VIGNELISGAVGYEQLAQAIKDVRS